MSKNDVESVRQTLRGINATHGRRLMSRDALILMRRTHELERQELCALWDQKRLHRASRLHLLKEIDDEIGLQTEVINGLDRQITILSKGLD